MNRVQRGSGHTDILELPGIGNIQILGEGMVAPLQRRPVRIRANHLAEIRRSDLQYPPEIHVIRIDNAGSRIFHCIHHGTEHACRDLQGSDDRPAVLPRATGAR